MPEQDNEYQYNSILNSNSTYEPDEAPQPPIAPKAKKAWVKSLISFLSAVAVVAIVLVVGGLISEQQAKRKAAEAEARAPKEATYFQSDETQPETVKNDVNVLVNEAYYSVENGLWFTLTFSNGYEKSVKITAVTMKLWNDKKVLLAAGKSSKIKNCTVAAGNVGELQFYLPPEYVKVTDDPLSNITYDCEFTFK